MEWIIFAFLIALIPVYFLRRRRFRAVMDSGLTYSFSFSADEVFAGEYLYLDQVVENTSDMLIPFLKMETLLPEGLRFVLAGEAARGKDELEQSVQSVFMLEPHSRVSRRWRIVTEQRGRFTAQSVQMHIISYDTVGMDSRSMRMQPQPSARDSLLVLPTAQEYLSQMALAPSFAGERTTPRGLVQDPMAVCGVREYQPFDALNTVDWKQTARLGHMVVKQTETQQNDSYHIVLNMQSVIIEPNFPAISTPAYTEDCISLCASLLDSAIRRNIPVRLMANAEPGDDLPGGRVHEGELGRHIFASESFTEKSSVIEAYRILARLPLSLSVPTERLLQDIMEHPHLYAQGGNIVFVTPFVDQRTVNFHRVMREQGVNVIFYVVSTYQNALTLPPELEAYFRVSQWRGGKGYAS